MTARLARNYSLLSLTSREGCARSHAKSDAFLSLSSAPFFPAFHVTRQIVAPDTMLGMTDCTVSTMLIRISLFEFSIVVSA